MSAFGCGQSNRPRVCPLLDDIVAKVLNRGATIFPAEDKTRQDVIAD
jgi:hypothetical protein